MLADGGLPPWAELRLRRALEIATDEYLITLSRGTVHKPPPLDERGFPITEADAGARYLLDQGVPLERVLTEAGSLDTIGNAYFSRVLHIDPMGLRRLLVITSEFHLERAEAIFKWVYGLVPNGYHLDFEAVPDVGISVEALHARQLKEHQSLRHLQETIERITTLRQLHDWLFFTHGAYRQGARIAPIGSALGTY